MQESEIRTDFNDLIDRAVTLVQGQYSYARLYEVRAYCQNGDPQRPEGMEIYFWYTKNRSLKVLYARGQFSKPEFIKEKRETSKNDFHEILKVEIEQNIPYWESGSLIGKCLPEMDMGREYYKEKLIPLLCEEAGSLLRMQKKVLELIAFICSYSDEREILVDVPMPGDREIINLPLMMSFEKALEILRRKEFDIAYEEARLVFPRRPGTTDSQYQFTLIGGTQVSIGTQTGNIKVD
ncbi:MAG: hypothetical protein NE327_20785 [Lentisphaeraceae bacterium]|nr:hypothetical protein [Lentisphaeraceae bacterium]